MREAITNLSKQQNQQLHHLMAQHTLDQKTSSKTQKYYRELRKSAHLLDQHSMEDLMRTAIIIAEKAQVVYTLTGDRVRGLSLSLNEMLRQGAPLARILPVLKVFLAHSKVADEQLREDLNQLVQELSQGVGFLQKFERAMEYFDFEELVKQTGYKEQFKAFTWVFFLQARQHLHIADQFQSDYLLIAVLYLTVRHAFDYIRPRNAPQLSGSRASQKNVVSSILQRLFQVFLIDDLTSFKNITTLVDDYFQSLLILGVIRCSNQENYDFLNPTHLTLNYRRLDIIFQKQKPPHSLDYRLLVPQLPHSHTPRRFSQLSQHGMDKRRNFKQKSFASHKILTFQPEIESVPSNEDSQRIQQIKLPANVKVSPSNTRTPLLWAFRHSPCSPIENYMHREVRQGKVGSMDASEEVEVLNCIREMLTQYCSSGLEDKVYLAYNYYVVVCQRFLKQEGRSEEQLSHYCSALLAYTLLIMVCSFNEGAVGGERVRVQLGKIRQMIITNGYYLWMVNAFFLKIADRLPSQLRHMANILEEIIMYELIWEEEDGISAEIIECHLSSQVRNSDRGKNVMLIVQCLIGKIETHIGRLMAEFNSIENWQKIESDVEKTVKYIILNAPQVIKDHSLLSVVLCSVYLVFRTNGLPIKFNEIVTIFQQINRIRASEYKRLVNEIEVCFEEQTQALNIIQFYNRLFLPQVKQHLAKIEQWTYEIVESNNSIGAQQPNRGSLKHSSRYSFYNLKENRLKKHLATEQMEKKEVRRLQSESSPIAQIELPLKQKVEKASAMRNETAMRSRPIASFLGFLNTEKIKSPAVIR